MGFGSILSRQVQGRPLAVGLGLGGSRVQKEKGGSKKEGRRYSQRGQTTCHSIS